MKILLRDLAPGSSYQVQLRAKSGERTSEWSPLLSFNTQVDDRQSQPPAGLTWNVSGTSFVAEWTKPTTLTDGSPFNNFSHFEIQVDWGGSIVGYNSQTERFDFTYEMNEAAFGTAKPTLSIAVRAVSVTGAESAWATSGPISNPAPGAPTSLTATQGIERVSLEWAPPADTDIAHYRVYRSATSGGTYTKIAEPLTNSYNYETTSTDMNYFRVFAVDVFGTESTLYASANQQAKPAASADTDPPANPTGVTVIPGFDVNRQQSYVDISWTNPSDSDLNNINIRYGTNGSTWQYLTLPATAGASQTHRLDVAAGTTVYIAVQAQDFTGNKSSYVNAGTYPVTAAADTTAPSKPAVPTVTGGVMIAFVSHNGNKHDGGSMEPDVARYEVHASTTSGFTASTSTMIGSINANSVAGSSFPIAATKASPTWYFRVVAVDRSGNRSPVSNQTTATINVINDSNINQTILDSITEAQGAASDANAIADLGYVANPTFSDWPSTAPTGWTNDAGTPVKETTIRRTGPNSVRYNTAAGANTYLNQSTTIPDSQYVTVEADIYLVSGSLQGSGILSRFYNTSSEFKDVKIVFSELIPNASIGKWYRVTKTIRRPNDFTGTFSSFRLFVMGGWTGFGTVAAKNIVFDRVTAWPATDWEIKAYEAATQQSVTEINLAANDLVLNGSAQDGTNKYFEAFTLDTTDAPAGAKASFKAPTTASSTLIGSQIIPIDPTKKYKFSFKARQTVPGTGSANTLYGMLVPHDAFGMTVSPYHYMYQANTTTTLAADLKPGDTVMQLTSAANWNNAAGASTHLRSAIFWNYVDAGGRVWPEHTYSRNWSGANFYADGGISGNNITLSVPYAGTLVPAGTKVSNGSSGGSYIYNPIGAVVPETWTEYSGIIGGIHQASGSATFASGFPPGCVAVKVGVLANYSTGGGRHAVAAFSLSDAAAAQATADQALTSANGKNKVTHSTSAPGTTANSIGDVWYQYNGSQQVIGFWRGNGGTSWTAQTLENAVISTMDAAKINTGVLNADRIGTRTLSTNKLLVSDMTNLLDDPDFIDTGTIGKNWVDNAGSGGWSVVNGEGGAGKAASITLSGAIAGGARLANTRHTRVRPGDVFTIATRYSSTASGGDANIAIIFRDEAGTYVTNASPIMLSATGGSYTNAPVTQVTVPSTAGIATMHFELRVAQAATLGTVTFQNPKLFRAANGELIVDGAITASKVGTNEVIANTANIKNAVITGAKLANATITDAKIADATITDAKIKNLKADKIEAGSALVTDITLDDGVDPVTGLASTGKIESANFDDVNKTGMQLSKDGLKIYDGYIAAKAVELKSSFNLMPAPMASFESIRRYYEDNIVTTNCTVDIVPESVVGEQSLEIVSTGTWTADLGTDQNIVVEPGKDYILSLSAKGDSGGENLKVRLQYDTGASTESISETLTTSFNRYHAIFTAPSGVTDCVVQLFGTSAVTVVVDAIQLEEKFGLLDTPSRWQPPSSTTIDGGQIRTGFIDADRIESGTISGDKLVAGFVESLEIEAQQIQSGELRADLSMIGRLMVGNRADWDGTTGVLTIYARELDSNGEKIPLIVLDPDGSVFRGRVVADDISVLNGLILLGVESRISSSAGLTVDSGVASPSSPPEISYTTRQAPWLSPPGGFTERGINWDSVDNCWIRLLVPNNVNPAGNTRVEKINPSTGASMGYVTLANITGIGEDDFNSIVRDGSYYYTALTYSTDARRSLCQFQASNGAFVDRSSPIYNVNGRCSVVSEISGSSKIGMLFIDENGDLVLRRYTKTGIFFDGETTSVPWDPEWSVNIMYADYNQTAGTLTMVAGQTARRWATTDSMGVPIFVEYDDDWAFDVGQTVAAGGAAPNNTGRWHASYSNGELIYFSNWYPSVGDISWAVYVDKDSTYHTAPSPARGLAITKRRRFVTVTLNEPPSGVTGADVYFTISATTPDLADYDLRNETLSSQRTIVFDPTVAGTNTPPPTSSTFPGGAPGWIKSALEPGWELRGDGTMIAREPTNNNDVATKNYVDTAVGGSDDTGWVDLTYVSGYSAGTAEQLRYRKIGKLVEIRGGGTGTFNAGSHQTLNADPLPVDCRPSSNVMGGGFGTGSRGTVVQVYTNGTIRVAPENGVTGVGWCSAHIMYFVD